MVVFVNDEPKVKVNYTKLYSENMFLGENVAIESTKSQKFSNQSLEDKITMVFFGYTSCPDFCPDTLARANKIFAKSGTLSNVKAYSGYVQTENGKNLAFAVIANNFNCSKSQIVKKMELIFNAMASY